MRRCVVLIVASLGLFGCAREQGRSVERSCDVVFATDNRPGEYRTALERLASTPGAAPFATRILVGIDEVASGSGDANMLVNDLKRLQSWCDQNA